MFRGGAIERHDLVYLWCDFMFDLGAAEVNTVNCCRIDGLLSVIDALPVGSTLKDLVKCCKGYVAGDKLFQQEVLQALSYNGILKVNGLPVDNIFLAEHRGRLSSHFYSNEWTFPLRFWSINGGTVKQQEVWPRFVK